MNYQKSQQLGNSVQLKIHSPLQANLPLPFEEFQRSTQQKQIKEQVNTAIDNNNNNSCTLPLQIQTVSTQGFKEQNNSLKQEASSTFVLEQKDSRSSKTQDNDEASTKSQFLEQSQKEQAIKNSLLPDSKQIKRQGSTQNSNDGVYHGNILQIEESFSPLSSTHNSQSSTIQINNLLASSGNSSKNSKGKNINLNNNWQNANSYNSIQDMPLLMKSPFNLNQSKEKQTTQQKHQMKEQNDSNKSLKLKRNSSSGSFQNQQKKNQYELNNNKGNWYSYIQDPEISCQNSLHIYNNNYVPINNLSQNQALLNFIVKSQANNSNMNLPRQQQPISSLEANHNKKYSESNQSSYFNQISTNSAEKNRNQQQDQINSNNSDIKPANLFFTNQQKQQYFQRQEDYCPQNVNHASLYSSSNKTYNQFCNISAATFLDSASDQKLNNNQITNNLITPFNFNEYSQSENKQALQSLTSKAYQEDSGNRIQQNKKVYMCKNHNYQRANHYALDKERNQQFFCSTCAALLQSQGYQLFSIEESLELNAMKMIVENKKQKEIQNKKEAVDKILFAVQDLIPQIKNTTCSMDRKEVNIYKFLEDQERNLEFEYNKLIYELNQNRNKKLNQLVQCKQDIQQKYIQANQICQQNLEQLIKLREDILDNYNCIVFEFEENKVASIIQNYFSIWNQAFINHDSIAINDKLVIYKSNQSQFQQINDQINFLCPNTLKQAVTTYIKLNHENSNMSTSILGQSHNRFQRNEFQFTRSKSSQQLIPQSSNDNSFQQRKLSQHLPFQSKRQVPQKQNQMNQNQNNIKLLNLPQQKTKQQQQQQKLYGNKPQTQNIKKNKNNYQRKIKSLQHSVSLNNKQVYISFDNKDAFKNHLDIDNKENINFINAMQVKFDQQMQKVQANQYTKAQSQPQLICIDIKDIQKMTPTSQSINNNNIHAEQTMFQNLSQENNFQTLNDCTTFRKRDSSQETESDTQISHYLENIINQANFEKQKLHKIQELNEQQIEKLNTSEEEQSCYNQNYQNDKHNQYLDVYKSMDRSKQNQTRIEAELESRVQGQTPNFSNKNDQNDQSPNNRNIENKQNSQNTNNNLREFNCLNEDPKTLDQIFEKERKSRDNSINKKKQYDEMIKTVQHNQIQRNLNCQNMLKIVQDSQIDLSSVSYSSTPQHLRSNSAQLPNISAKSSLQSSKNRYLMRSDEYLNSEQYNQVQKQIEEIISFNKSQN